MYRRKFIFVRASLFLLLALGSALFFTTTFQHSAQAAAADEWPTYLGGPQHTNYQSTETTLNASNVPWSLPVAPVPGARKWGISVLVVPGNTPYKI